MIYLMILKHSKPVSIGKLFCSVTSLLNSIICKKICGN